MMQTHRKAFRSKSQNGVHPFHATGILISSLEMLLRCSTKLRGRYGRKRMLRGQELMVEPAGIRLLRVVAQGSTYIVERGGTLAAGQLGQGQIQRNDRRI